MFTRTVAVGTAFFLFVIAQPAYAEVDCNAVLRNGAFKYSEYKNNSYYQQIVFTHFLESTFESSKSDTSLGLGVPIGEAVMGTLNYDRDAYNAKKRSMEDTRFQRITAINETQTMLSSGDAEILKAWNQCIRDHGGGLAVRFEPRTATLATLVIEWLPVGPISQTRLDDEIVLPGIDMRNDVSNPRCFRRKTWIKQGVGCRSTIKLPDAWTPLAIAVNTNSGTQDAFLPARIKLVNERVSLTVPALYEELFRRGRGRVQTKVFSLSPEDQAAGWVIDPLSITKTVKKVFDNGRSGMNWCADPQVTATVHQLNYDFAFNSEQRGHDGWTLGCQMTVTAEKIRSRWVPDEIVALPEPPLNYVPVGVALSKSDLAAAKARQSQR